MSEGRGWSGVRVRIKKRTGRGSTHSIESLEGVRAFCAHSSDKTTWTSCVWNFHSRGTGRTEEMQREGYWALSHGASGRF